MSNVAASPLSHTEIQIYRQITCRGRAPSCLTGSHLQEKQAKSVMFLPAYSCLWMILFLLQLVIQEEKRGKCFQHEYRPQTLISLGLFSPFKLINYAKRSLLMSTNKSLKPPFENLFPFSPFRLSASPNSLLTFNLGFLSLHPSQPFPLSCPCFRDPSVSVQSVVGQMK